MNGNQFTLNVGNTTSLNINQLYQGTVTVQAQTSAGTQIGGVVSVNLQVGNMATTGANGALFARGPRFGHVQRDRPRTGDPASQNVSVTLNGAIIPVVTATFVAVPAGFDNFLNYQVNANGTVTISVNSVESTQGIYQGNLTLSTNSGSVVVPITLCFGSVSCSGAPVSQFGNGLTVSPSNTLTFNVQTGGSTPSQNVSILFNGAPIPLSGVAASIGENFILPSFQSGNIVNMALNSAGSLARDVQRKRHREHVGGPSQYPGQSHRGRSPDTELSVRTSMSFAYQSGASNPPPQTISVTSNGTAVNFAASATTNTGGPGWLVVTPATTTATPGTVTVTVLPNMLQPGQTYTGNVQINTFGGATNATINIPVSLLVSVNPILTAAPNALTFTAQAGGVAPAQTIQIATSGAVLPYQVSSAVASPAGGFWLQVPTQQGVTPGSFTVSVNTQGLPPGNYAGTVIVTSQTAGNGAISIPVTLTVTAGATLQLSTGALNFAYEVGQLQPQPQSVSVSSINGVTALYSHRADQHRSELADRIAAQRTHTQ